MDLRSMGGNGKGLFNGDGIVTEECEKDACKVAGDEGVGRGGAWPVHGVGNVGLDNQGRGCVCLIWWLMTGGVVERHTLCCHAPLTSDAAALKNTVCTLLSVNMDDSCVGPIAAGRPVL